MPYERAADKDNTTFYKINLEFTGFEENPPTITLANWSPQPGTILDIVIPALPKPNISGFRGWKIK